MPKFKKNPAAVLRDAKSKPAFNRVEPACFDVLLEKLADQDLRQTVLSRMWERSRAFEVDINAI